MCEDKSVKAEMGTNATLNFVFDNLCYGMVYVNFFTPLEIRSVIYLDVVKNITHNNKEEKYNVSRVVFVDEIHFSLDIFNLNIGDVGLYSATCYPNVTSPFVIRLSGKYLNY